MSRDIFWSNSTVSKDFSDIFRSTILSDCKVTSANTASSFGEDIDRLLELRTVAKMIEWECAERDPAHGSAKESIMRTKMEMCCYHPSCKTRSEGTDTLRWSEPLHQTRSVLGFLGDKTVLMGVHRHNTVYERLGLMICRGTADSTSKLIVPRSKTINFEVF